MTHQYATIKSHPLLGSGTPDPEVLEQLRTMQLKWPDAKFAAAQCVDLNPRTCGHLRFMAVGPSNSIKTIDQPRLTHWSYYFVGFVDLESGRIVPFDPAEQEVSRA